MPQPVEQGLPLEKPGSEVAMAVIEVTVADGDGAGMVVVNRQAVGLAPQRVELPVTAHGFLRQPVSVAVRFVATDVTESSFSVEEVLEITDRPPTRLVFSRDDQRARRVFAEVR